MMNIKLRKTGVTLVEMVVALAIMLGMLLAASLVFKSSTQAAGKAMARNDMMQQLFVMKRQLDSDFIGFERNSPFAVIFESSVADSNSTATFYDTDPSVGTDLFERNDRIVFYSNGSFDTWGDTIAPGSIGRIFYGQTSDNEALTVGDLSRLDTYENFSAAYNVYPRRVLSRRMKVFSVDTSSFNFVSNINALNAVDSALYDLNSIFVPQLPQNISVFPAGASDWSDPAVVDFQEYYNYFFDENQNISFIRRPNIFNSEVNFGNRAVQRLFMLPDVTNFKIELWFPGARDWFPNVNDLSLIQTINGLNGEVPTDAVSMVNYSNLEEYKFGFYWNAPFDATFDQGGTTKRKNFFTPNILNGTGYDTGRIEWRSETAITELVNATGVNGIDLDGDGTEETFTLGWTSSWPLAIRFTFTLHDKDRRHFPEGETFSYILNLPQ